MTNPVSLLTTPFSRTLLGVTIASVVGIALPGTARTPYFLPAATFFLCAIGLALIGLALGRRPPARENRAPTTGVSEAIAHAAAAESTVTGNLSPKADDAGPATTASEALGHTLGLVAFALFGYGVMELFYGAINLKMGLGAQGSFWAPLFGELDTYVLDRSYQYLALLIFFGLLRCGLGKAFTHFLGTGDSSRETVILGAEQPMPWRRACIRLCVMMVSLAALGLLARPQTSFDLGRCPSFLGRLLGGTNNSFIEELLFRGMLLPALLVRIGASPANWLQAMLFSVIHWSYVGDGTWAPVQQEAVKLGLYTGIGLLFGRAALETRGIGISTLLHALITASIWTHLTFAGG